jgi:hypothetical protein
MERPKPKRSQNPLKGTSYYQKQWEIDPKF